MVFQPSAFQPPSKPSFRERVARLGRYLPSFPPSAPGPETESIRARAGRDTDRIKRTWLARGILIAIELAALVIVEEVLVSANKASVRVAVLIVLAAAVPFAVIGCVFVFQAARAPFRQRKEWRTQLSREREEARRCSKMERERAEERIAAERGAFEKKWNETEHLRGLLGDSENEARDLRVELEAVKAEPPVEKRRRRQEVKDLLGRVHRRGVEFLDEPTFINDLTVLEWHRDMYRVVREAYGEGEAAVFLESLPPESEFDPDSPLEWINPHLKPVASIIERADSLDPHDEFNAEDWEDFFP
jgi:hypothetical protein